MAKNISEKFGDNEIMSYICKQLNILQNREK